MGCLDDDPGCCPVPVDVAVGPVSSESLHPAGGGLGSMGLDPSNHDFVLVAGWGGVVLLG